MGLDNGIIMKKITRNQLDKIPDFVKYELFRNDDNTYDIELAYWRKCWNVRDAIINAINPYCDLSSTADCDIDKDDIPALIRGLMPLFDRSAWIDGRKGSIWTFEEQFNNMIQVVLNLKWLETFLKENPDVKVRFYDSF